MSLKKMLKQLKPTRSEMVLVCLIVLTVAPYFTAYVADRYGLIERASKLHVDQKVIHFIHLRYFEGSMPFVMAYGVLSVVIVLSVIVWSGSGKKKEVKK